MRRLLLAAVACVVACASEETRIDPFPVSVDRSSGAIVGQISPSVDEPPFAAVLDTLSPVTILDGFVPGEPEPTPRRRQTELILFDAGGDIPRLSFRAVSAFQLHPCTGVDDLCVVGMEDQTAQIRGVIGADVLSRQSVRIDFAAGDLRFFPDIAGDDRARGRMCEAVFSSPFAGGGTLILSGAEVSFTGNRIAVDACLHFDVDQERQVDRGSDALFVVATGLAVSVLAESAYERYAALVNDAGIAPPLASLPETEVHLASGTIAGRLGSISRMALVGEGADDRGPCQELYANHVLAIDACNAEEDPVDPCPCTDNARFCNTAAAVELDRQIPVVVVPDLTPLLQALRDELRPEYPEVDGVLAPSALAPTSVDVDYPNNRLVARCVSDGCATRPAVLGRESLSEIAGCIAEDPGPVTSPRE